MALIAGVVGGAADTALGNYADQSALLHHSHDWGYNLEVGLHDVASLPTVDPPDLSTELDQDSSK